MLQVVIILNVVITTNFLKLLYNICSRDVAQLGSALPWGGRGREFEAHRSDHFIETSPKILLKESKIKRGNF